MASTKTVKRVTTIVSDVPNERLHSGEFGEYNSRKFSSTDKPFDDKAELVIGKSLWDRLGKPHSLRVTVTAIFDD